MRYIILCAAAILAACASSPPIDMTGVEKTLTPDTALKNPDWMRGRRAAWGGTIVNLRNLKDTTEIEVLGYPLETNGQPDRGSTPQHRFLIIRQGYLEAADYRNGRSITATGTTNGIRNGTVGEAPYIYPILQAEQLYLWPVTEEVRRNPNVHFGVGVIFGR